MTCTWNCAGWCAPGGDPTVCRPYPCVPNTGACPGSICVEDCSGQGNVTVNAEATTNTPFPLMMLLIPAIAVVVLLVCCVLFCGRSFLRSRMSRLSLPRLGASLPNVRLTRKPAAPAPTDALARQLQAATERAAMAPEGAEATGISSGFSVLDPTRKEVAVTKLWETWEEEEYRFLQTNAAEQAQLVGKSGFADGRSSWARKIPALQVPAVQKDFSPDLRLIPPKAKGVRFVAGTEESENQAEEEWKFLEDQSAENAEVEEQINDAQSGGSDGPTAAPEPQESHEDAANLKQVAMLLQRVEQLEAELHARPSSDAKEPPSDGQETFSVEAVAAAAAAAVLQSLQPIAEVKEAQNERGTGSGSQEEEVASAWVPDEAESRLPALCSGGPGIRGADVLAAKADALKGTADEGPQERLERFRRFKYISSNETVPPGARAAGTERRRPSASEAK